MQKINSFKELLDILEKDKDNMAVKSALSSFFKDYVMDMQKRKPC